MQTGEIKPPEGLHKFSDLIGLERDNNGVTFRFVFTLKQRDLARLLVECGAWHGSGFWSGMSFYKVAPLFSESEIQKLEDQASNPAELFIIRRFLEDHARGSVKETEESICQSGDTVFLESNVNRVCSGLTKHPALPDSKPNVKVLVSSLSDFILAKAKQLVSCPWRTHFSAKSQSSSTTPSDSKGGFQSS